MQGVVKGKTMGWLNAIVSVQQALPAPVAGVLGPSYKAAASSGRTKALAARPLVASVGVTPRG